MRHRPGMTCPTALPALPRSRLAWSTSDVAEWLGVTRAEAKRVLRSWGVQPTAVIASCFRPKDIKRQWPAEPCESCAEAKRLQEQAVHQRDARRRASARWTKQVRRQRIRANGGTATAEQVAARVAYFGDRCWMCHGPWQHLDHVLPVRHGGLGWASNLRPACTWCNTSKGARKARPLPRVRRPLP